MCCARRVMRYQDLVALSIAALTYPVGLLIVGDLPWLETASFLATVTRAAECLVVTVLSYAYICRPLIFALSIALDSSGLEENCANYMGVSTNPQSEVVFPPVSIHIPLYDEDWDLVEPTLVQALQAIDYYRAHAQADAALHVSDDGLQMALGADCAFYGGLAERIHGSDPSLGASVTARRLLAEANSRGLACSPSVKSAMSRIAFYVAHGVCVVARPQHSPGEYERRGQFPKASNLNEMLRLDSELERLAMDGPGHDQRCEELLVGRRRRGFFVLGRPSLGRFILVLDKDSGTPLRALLDAVPILEQDETTAFTVHPTAVANARANTLTRIVQVGSILYNNFWLPNRARYGMLFFPGHNSIVRKEALAAIGYWPENRVAEDYVASLRMRMTCVRGRPLHGVYVNRSSLVFTESVPEEYMAHVRMLGKFAVGSFQMCLRPLAEWLRSGPMQDDLKRFICCSTVTRREKISALLELLPYAAIVLVPGLVLFRLPQMDARRTLLLLAISLVVFLSTSTPLWVARVTVKGAWAKAYGLLDVPRYVPLAFLLPATALHLSLPWYVVPPVLKHFLGERSSFGSTNHCSVGRCCGLRECFRGGEGAVAVVVFYGAMVGATFGRLGSPIDWIKCALCGQWVLAVLLAPVCFGWSLRGAGVALRAWAVARMESARANARALRSWRPRSHDRDALVLLATLVIAGISFHVFRDLSYNGPSIDETFYQVLGKRFLDGGGAAAGEMSGAAFLWPVISYLSGCMGGLVGSRAVGALCGLATLVLVYRIGLLAYSRSLGSRAVPRVEAGLVSIVLYGTAATTIWCSRTATHDSIALLFMAAGLLQLLGARRADSVPRYWASAAFCTLAFMASYSTAVCLLPLMLGSMVGPDARAGWRRRLMRFPVPVALLLALYWTVGEQDVAAAILNAHNSFRVVPHVQSDALGVLARYGSMLRVPLLATFVLLIAWAFVRPRVTPWRRVVSSERAWLVLPAVTLLAYYVLGSHVQSMERKAAMSLVFLAPLVGGAAVRQLNRFPTTALGRSARIGAVLLVGAVALVDSTPTVRALERAHIDVAPVAEALESVIEDQHPCRVAYISRENIFYLKNRLERSHPNVLVDADVPWGPHWADRIRDGWRPEIIAGCLVSRYLPEPQRRAEEADALDLLREHGYQLRRTLQADDSAFGACRIHVVARQRARAQISALPMPEGLGVAYSPTGYDPEVGIYPSEDSIRADLELLRRAGYQHLLTYGSEGTLGSIPSLARQVGFAGCIIQGIWDPLSRQEWESAVAQRGHVQGYCVGNEGLGVRYDMRALRVTMEELRVECGKPVTTAEKMGVYLDPDMGPQLIEQCDYLLPIAHPYWHGVSSGAEAAMWIASRYDSLLSKTDKPIILKEAGLPVGGGSTFSEEDRTGYYEGLDDIGVAYFQFEAFDQPWKTDRPEEATWGIYRADRSRKLTMKPMGDK